MCVDNCLTDCLPAMGPCGDGCRCPRACGGGVCLYARNPAEPGSVSALPVHALTGLYCPGCGTLRALHQLMHGTFGGAVDLAVGLAAGGGLWNAFARPTNGGSQAAAGAVYSRPMDWDAAGGDPSLLGGWRNAPLYPFLLLAPHWLRNTIS